tara:strand:- start:251 stop:742 length:492 start_codon:yes stop_codon:yes gene_type:complete
MIIECINCHKKFEVDSDLIPESGRNIQCGSCNHIWFFNINNEEYSKNLESSSHEMATKFEEKNNPNHQEIGSINSDKTEVNKSSNKTQKMSNLNKSKSLAKSNFTLINLLSITLVLIISFVALITILDTFKLPLYNIFPQLEVVMFNLFETIIDISLFIKDLI